MSRILAQFVVWRCPGFTVCVGLVFVVVFSIILNLLVISWFIFYFQCFEYLLFLYSLLIFYFVIVIYTSSSALKNIINLKFSDQETIFDGWEYMFQKQNLPFETY